MKCRACLRKLRKVRRAVALLIALVVVATVFGSCARLKPFSEVKAEVGESSYIDYEGHAVYRIREGSGPAVVFLHGFAASSYSFRDVIPQLSADYTVIAPDWFGFGYTERPTDESYYEIPKQVEMLRAVLEKESVQGAHFVGHSFGSILAYAYAKRYPGEVRSLTFISPPLALDEVPFVMRWWLGRAAAYPFIRLMLSRETTVYELFLKGYHDPQLFTTESSNKLREMLLTEGLWHTLHGFFGANDEAGTFEWQALDIPVMICAGEEDTVVPLDDVKAVHEQFPGARFEIVEACGHNMPEEVPEMLVQFLKSFFESAQLR